MSLYEFCIKGQKRGLSQTITVQAHTREDAEGQAKVYLQKGETLGRLINFVPMKALGRKP